eukprot:8178012-Ditylum_brightwellii.AAC.1
MKHPQTALLGKYQRYHAPTKINLTNMSLTPPLNMIIKDQNLAEINLKNMRSTPHPLLIFPKPKQQNTLLLQKLLLNSPDKNKKHQQNLTIYLKLPKNFLFGTTD